MVKHLGQRKMRLLPVLLWLMLPAFSFAGGPSAELELERTQESPRYDILVEHYASDDGRREIWLAPKKSPSDRVLLYTHGRYAEVLMSPDEQWLVINDYAGSDIAHVLLFKRGQGISFSEVKGAEIGQKTWRFFAGQNRLIKSPDYHHMYVEGIRWASNSKALLVSIWGHSDGKNYLDPWLCVFKIDSLRASLDLRLMNRDAFHSEDAKRKKVGTAQRPE